MIINLAMVLYVALYLNQLQKSKLDDYEKLTIVKLTRHSPWQFSMGPPTNWNSKSGKRKKMSKHLNYCIITILLWASASCSWWISLGSCFHPTPAQFIHIHWKLPMNPMCSFCGILLIMIYWADYRLVRCVENKYRNRISKCLPNGPDPIEHITIHPSFCWW